jgi:GxxExxY protein
MQHKDTKIRRHKERRRDLHQVIGASIEVHQTLGGPGLLESIYEAALCHELILKGLRVHRQRPVQSPDL